MKLGDVINPWAALAAARRLAEMLDERRKSAEAAAEDIRNRWKIHTAAQSREIAYLRGLIVHAHFRDPADGRIGAKGVVPRSLMPKTEDIVRDR